MLALLFKDKSLPIKDNLCILLIGFHLHSNIYWAVNLFLEVSLTTNFTCSLTRSLIKLVVVLLYITWVSPTDINLKSIEDIICSLISWFKTLWTYIKS